MRGLLVALAAAVASPTSVAAEASSSSPVEIVNRVVPVDGSTMSLHVSGSGEATIVLEAGSGGDHRNWALLHQPLNALGQVVSYDRLDYGGSGRSPRPRSAKIVAEQLREGLRRAGVKPPFLLVGHSYGGALVRVFASQYPEDVIGLVLVDPAMEDFYTRATLEAPEAYLAGLENALEEDDRSASDALRREYLAYETSIIQTRLARPPPGERVVLISAAQQLQEDPAMQRLWLDTQRQWALRIGARRVLVDAGHNIPRSRPEVVVDAVRSLLGG